MRNLLHITVAALLSSGLYATGLWAGPVAAPFVFLVPLPGLIVATVEPLGGCLLWCALVGILVGAGAGASAAIGFAVPLGLPTLALAAGLRRSWSFERTALSGILAWSLGVAGVACIAFGNFNTLLAAARQQLLQSFDVALTTSGSIASDGTLAILEAERDEVVSWFVELLPALVVLTGAVMVIANLMLLRSWSGERSDVNLRLWRTPDPLIWALIVTGFAMFLPSYEVTVGARNVFLVLLGCYFCQGLAIVSYYLDRLRLPKGIQVAGYLLIAVQHIVAAMVLALGVFDLWGNFRRLGTGSADLPFDGDGE